jgi:hypothetical protein
MDIHEQIRSFIDKEAARIAYGKLFIEITIANGRMTNIQGETKRSMNIN